MLDGVQRDQATIAYIAKLQLACSHLPRLFFVQVDLASMHVQCSIRGICSVASSLPISRSACIALQPGTGHLALASTAATLQLYDPRR